MSDCVHIHVEGSATVVNPGDLVLITLAPGSLDEEFYDYLVQRLREHLPIDANFLIVEGNAAVFPAPTTAGST